MRYSFASKGNWSSAFALLVGVSLIGSALTACGGSNGSPPTSPTGPQTGPPAASTSVTVSAVSFPDRTAAITWAPAARATGYDLLLGTSRGARDLGVVSVEGTTTHTVRDIPFTPSLNGGTTLKAHWVTVLARNSEGISANGPSAGLIMADMKLVVDALFFHRGEYANLSGVKFNPTFQAWGWPRGSEVRVRIASTFSTAQKERVRQAMDQLNDAFGGAVRLNVEDHESSLPVFTLVLGQVILARVSADVIAGKCSVPEGCIPVYRNPNGVIIGASGAVVDIPNGGGLFIPSHELGHGAGGLGHLEVIPQGGQGDAFPWFHFALMGNTYSGVGNGALGIFAPWELEAIRSVYSAGLGGGSSRSEFIARGLVNP